MVHFGGKRALEVFPTIFFLRLFYVELLLRMCLGSENMTVVVARSGKDLPSTQFCTFYMYQGECWGMGGYERTSRMGYVLRSQRVR